MIQYGKQDYWENRYSREPEVFEWYQRYLHFSDLLKTHITKESHILIIGCGSSKLGEELYDEGY
jgi:hypothetical protein